jgi:peptide chain release factor 1
MDFSGLIALKHRRFEELEALVGSADLYTDPEKARSILREHARLKEVIEAWKALGAARAELEATRELIASGDDELAQMACEEEKKLSERIAALEKEVQIGLLPPEPGEDRDAIVEIRAGTGGTEAALFAADLFRMYSRFAENAGLKLEQLDVSPADLGGLKQVVFKVSGAEVFRKLRYESGVHRVQRVPATEAQGRIHTSTATVAVMPEAKEVDVEIRPEDIRVEVCRAGGPGGQGVNTTDSAVQIVHLPTGKIVRCQDGRSQLQNRERAMQILRARLLEEKIREENEKYSAYRKSLIGSGGREEKIRTYNFPQNLVTDHRIDLTLYNLDRFIDGEIEPVLNALESAYIAQRLQEATR